MRTGKHALFPGEREDRDNMGDSPIRVLQVVTQMTRGGLETMLMNYYRHIDRTKVQFDFLEHRSYMADYDEEILALGGRIHRLPRLNPLSRGYLAALDGFFADHPEYRIVHSHLDCMAGIPLKAAQKHGIPTRIAHAHSSNQNKNLKYPIKLIFRQSIPRYATDLFACGQEAGRWMFRGHDFTVLNNAVDAESYAFDPDVRAEVRQEFGIDPRTLVVGHVGRFSPEKNHKFLIDIFYSLAQKRADSRLLLVGTGALEREIREQCNKLGIQDRVIFAGIRSDVNRILQAMDVFMMPSLYEGLGIVAVEAQAAGLPCIASDRVPEECVRTNGLVHFLSLKETPDRWAQEVLQQMLFKRTDRSSEIRRNEYDIRENAKWLQDFYLTHWN